jgi:predicted esterase
MKVLVFEFFSPWQSLMMRSPKTLVFFKAFSPTLVGMALVVASALSCATVTGQDKAITLSNGLVVTGEPASLEKYSQSAMAGSQGGIETILMVYDGYRRVFTNDRNVTNQADSPSASEIFSIPQPTAKANSGKAGLGMIVNYTPFSLYGRRTMVIRTPSNETVTMVQGIVDATPKYLVVKTVWATDATYLGWEMRLSTSSIPGDVLSKILRRQTRRDNITDRLRIVSFYEEAERYREAELELTALLDDFPEIREERNNELKLLRQAWANQLVRKLEDRSKIGQTQFVRGMIKAFPRKDVAAEILARVGTLQDELDANEEKITRTREAFVLTLSEFKAKAKLAADRMADVDAIAKEIQTDLNIHNLDRLAAYNTLRGGAKIDAERSLSLAISGWLLGTDMATDNIAVSVAAISARAKVLQYLQAKLAVDRKLILDELASSEASSPELLAAIIKQLLPYGELTQPDPNIPGMYELTAPGLEGEEPPKYVIQLPPEYNPYRRYPCIVTLNSGRTTVYQQIDWWAGSFDASTQSRRGEATQHGYIVISPVWKPDAQLSYDYTAQEHYRVLATVRDALLRFSIDTDRIFLSGHGLGGDAAWDIASAHPDLWAGVVCIGARADKRYLTFSHENARFNLPFYFVHGEKDYSGTLANAIVWNRYLDKPGYDMMLVEYEGRGQEHFYEEIGEIIKWVDFHRRNPVVEKFTCHSMRPWDNFFWCLEIDEFLEKNLVLPQAPANERSRSNKSELLELNRINNSIRIDCDAPRFSLLLSPEWIDFGRPVTINSEKGELKPDREVLLEDARTRRDRQHLFSVKVKLQKNKWRKE